MTRHTPTELREMADLYDLCAEDYGYRASISEALKQAADDAEDAILGRAFRDIAERDYSNCYAILLKVNVWKKFHAAIDAARKETT